MVLQEEVNFQEMELQNQMFQRRCYLILLNQFQIYQALIKTMSVSNHLELSETDSKHERRERKDVPNFQRKGHPSTNFQKSNSPTKLTNHTPHTIQWLKWDKRHSFLRKTNRSESKDPTTSCWEIWTLNKGITSSKSCIHRLNKRYCW